MIELKNVSKVYNNYNYVNITALRGINLKLARSGLCFIVGASGSGKSTLLNILAGIDIPTGGGMLVNGVDTKQFSAKGMDGYRNNFVGIIYQDLNLLDHLTFKQNVALSVEVQGKKADPAEISALFKKLGIDGLENRYPNQCSGGQCQRAAIARVLIKKPKVLIADEPTSNVDQAQRIEIYQLLRELSKEILVITSTHSQEMMERFADRVITLDAGIITSDVITGDDKTNVEVFGKGEVVAIEAGTLLNPHDVDKLNNIISTCNKKPVYLCVETSVDKVQENHPVAAKEIVKTALKEKQKQKETQKAAKRQLIEEDVGGGVVQFDKTRLPVRTAATISFINFKSNTVRSFFTILLSILAITFYALVSNVSSLSLNRAMIDSFQSSDEEYVTFTSNDRLFTTADKSGWIAGKTADKDFKNSSLVYNFGPGITMDAPSFTSDSSASIFAVSKVAVLDNMPAADNVVGSKNVFGQRLLNGSWPQGSTNGIVISDFMAKQIQTVYYSRNHGEQSTALSFENLIGQEISVNGVIKYKIIGIYETDYSKYFAKTETYFYIPDEVLSESKHYDALRDMQLIESLSKLERQQAEYYLQNNFVTGYVSKNFIDKVLDGSSAKLSAGADGIHYVAGEGLRIGGVSSVIAADYIITDSPNGVDSGALYEAIRDLGVEMRVYRDGDPNPFETGSQVRVSKALYSMMFGVDVYADEHSVMNFKISKKVQSYSALPNNLIDVPSESASTVVSFHELDELNLVIDESLIDDDVNFVMMLPEALYKRVVGSIVVPSTSFIVANTYSAGDLGKILGRMGEGVEVSFADSAAVLEFINGFTASSDIIKSAAIVFGMFAVFMMYNYIYQSIRSKRKNIAIIRSLGAKTRDVFLIFMLEALLLSALIFVGAFGVIAIAGAVSNAVVMDSSGFALKIFSIDAAFISVVLAVSVLVIFVCYMLPVFGFARHKRNRGLVQSIHVQSEN